MNRSYEYDAVLYKFLYGNMDNDKIMTESIVLKEALNRDLGVSYDDLSDFMAKMRGYDFGILLFGGGFKEEDIRKHFGVQTEFSDIEYKLLFSSVRSERDRVNCLKPENQGKFCKTSSELSDIHDEQQEKIKKTGSVTKDNVIDCLKNCITKLEQVFPAPPYPVCGSILTDLFVYLGICMHEKDWDLSEKAYKLILSYFLEV